MPNHSAPSPDSPAVRWRRTAGDRRWQVVAFAATFGVLVPSISAWAQTYAEGSVTPDVDTTRSAPPTQVARASATVSIPLTILPAEEPADPGKAPGDAESPVTVEEAAGTSTEPSEASEARSEAPVAITDTPVTTQAPPVVATPVPQVCVEPDPLCESAADHDVPVPTTAAATSTAPETTTAPSSQPETTAPEPTGATGLVDELVDGIEEIVT